MPKQRADNTNFKRSRLSSAVSLACLSLSTGPLLTGAVMADSCPQLGGGTTTIATNVSGDTCDLGAGEKLIVTRTGSLTGTNPAVYVGSPAGAITNRGTIGDTGNTRAIVLDSGSLADSLINEATGLITGSEYGIYLYDSSIAGDLINNGTIAVEGTYGIYLTESSIGGSLINNGLIDNTAGGTNPEDGYGIFLYSSSIGGDLINAGTIRAGDYYGIYLYETTIGGSLVNSGLINLQDDTSYGHGMHLYSSSITGHLTNSGTILAQEYYGIYLYDTAIGGDLTNSGLIDNADGQGIHIYSSTIGGNLHNSGTILATEYYGIYLYGSSIGGDLVNDGVIRNTNGQGMHLYSVAITGSLMNNGTIAADEYYGIYLYGSAVGGDVVNSGLIGIESGTSGIGQGLWIESSNITGSVINSGTIQATETYSLYIVDSSVGGDVVNSGLLDNTIEDEDAGYGIYIDDSTIGGSIWNSGTIKHGDYYGIYLYGSVGGDIVNSGLITSRVGTSHGQGIFIDSSSVGGNVVNSGTIFDGGGEYGIYLYGTSVGGMFENSGTVVSDEGVGVFFGSSTIGGGIYNSGTIMATMNHAVLFDDMNQQTTFTNSGLIDGTVELDDNILELAGENGRVTGMVTGGTGSIARVTGTFTPEADFMVDTFEVASTGLLKVGNPFVPTSDGDPVMNMGVVVGKAGTPGTITGDLTNVGGGAVGTIIHSPTSYGQLNVTGTADISDGNNVNVMVGRVLIEEGTVFEDIVTAGTLTTSGALNTTDDNLFYDFVAVKDGNTIDVTTEQGVSVAEAVEEADLPYAEGAAEEFDNIIFGGGTGGPIDEVILQLASLGSEAEVANAVAQMVPVLAGGLGAASTLNANMFSNVIGNRITGKRGLSAGDGMYEEGHLWIKPFGGYADQDNRSGRPGFDADTIGVSFGGDVQVNSRLLLGAGFAYSDTEVDGNTISRNEADIETYQLVFYGNYDLNETDFVEGYAIVGWNDNDTVRDINFGTRSLTAKGDTDSIFTRIYAGIGRDYKQSDKLTLTPVLNLRYTYIDQDGYTEEGAGALNLRVKSTDEDSLILGLDGVGAYNFDGPWTATVRAGIGYDVAIDRAIVTSTFTGGGGAFSTSGIKPDEFVYRAGFGLKAEPKEMMSVRIDYEFEGRSDWQSHGGAINFRWQFH